MTRVNFQIDPSELCDQHLRAEWRELMRLRHAAAKRIQELDRAAALGKRARAIPPTFRLGTGHVRYFADKGVEVITRHKAIYDEMIHRGFQPDETKLLTSGVWPKRLYHSANLSSAQRGHARSLLQQRISLRLAEGRPKLPRWTNRHRPTWCNLERLKQMIISQ